MITAEQGYSLMCDESARQEDEIERLRDRLEKDEWQCSGCGGEFIFGGKPNFCPYCRSRSLRRSAEPRP